MGSLVEALYTLNSPPLVSFSSFRKAGEAILGAPGELVQVMPSAVQVKAHSSMQPLSPKLTIQIGFSRIPGHRNEQPERTVEDRAVRNGIA